MSHTRSRAVLIAAVAALVLGALGAFAQQGGQANPFVQGVDAVRAGQYQTAETALQQAVKATPDNGPAWYYLGVARFRQGKLASALQALQKARDLNPGRPGPELYIGQIYEQQGAYDEAIRAYEREIVFRHGSGVAEVFVAMGRTYYELGRYSDVVDTMRKVLRLEPRYVEAMYWMGRAYSKQQDYDDAEKIFDQARTTLRDWQDAQRSLTHQSKVENEAMSKAADEPSVAQDYHWAEQFGTVLAMWPDLNRARGNTYLLAGSYARARNAYRKMLDPTEGGNAGDPEPYVLMSLADVAEAKQAFTKEGAVHDGIGILTDATQQANKAVEFNGNYAPAYAALGRIYLTCCRNYISDPANKIVSHSYDDAVEQFKKALDLNGNYVGALVGLGETYLDEGDSKGAGTADASQDYSDAVTNLEKAVTISPKDAQIHALLSRAYLSSDRQDEALSEAEDALKLDTKNVVALNCAGSVYYFRGDLSTAAHYFEQAVQTAPNDIQSHVNLANTYFQMQSWYRALEEYQAALALEPTQKLSNTAAERARLEYSIALCHDHTQAWDQEINALSMAVYLDGSFFDAYLQMARGYEAQEQWRAAEQALRVAAQKADNDADRVRAFVQLGQVLERAGKPDEAVAAYTAAANLDPNNPAAQQALERLQTHASSPTQ